MSSVNSKSIRKNRSKRLESVTPDENTDAALSSDCQESSKPSVSSRRGSSKKAKDALILLDRPSSVIDRSTSLTSASFSNTQIGYEEEDILECRSGEAGRQDLKAVCPSASASTLRAKRRGARGELLWESAQNKPEGQEKMGANGLRLGSAPTSTRQDETVGQEPTLSSKSTSASKKGRGGKAKISSTTPTQQNEMAEDETNPSSESASTVRRKKVAAKAELSSQSLRREETSQEKPPLYCSSTFTRQNEAANKERELSPAAESPAKKNGRVVRGNVSSAPKSTNLGDTGEDRPEHFSATKSRIQGGMAAEEFEDNPASTPTVNKKGRGAKDKHSSTQISTKQEETGERHETSSSNTLYEWKDACLEASFEDPSATQKERKESLGLSYCSPSGRQADTEGEEPESVCPSTSKLTSPGVGARPKLSSKSTSVEQERTGTGKADRSRLPPTLGIAGDARQATPRRRKLNELKLMKEAEEVMRKAGIEISANPTRQGNEFFDEEVKLENKEKLGALSECRLLTSNIVESLDNGSAWNWKVLNSGSSYDGTKVARADEMDCMFIPEKIKGKWMEVVLEGAPDCYCFVRVTDLREADPRYAALKELCDDRMFLNVASFKNKVFDLIKKGVGNTRNAKVEPFSGAGAALPAKYYVIPKEDGGLDPISLDLVPALHFASWPQKLTRAFSKLPDNVRKDVEKVGVHVVPKTYQGDGFQDDRDYLWRVSFSAAEKQMTKYIDGKYRDPNSRVVTTYRKIVLRMAKRILEIAKEVDNSRHKRLCQIVKELMKAVKTLQEQRNVEVKCFSTFQIRTLMWDDFYIRLPADEDWERTKCRTRLQETLASLKKMLTGEKEVYHFFVPEMNIVEQVSFKEKEFLYIIFCIAEKLF